MRFLGSEARLWPLPGDRRRQISRKYRGRTGCPHRSNEGGRELLVFVR